MNATTEIIHLTFDTLQFAKRAEHAGFTKEQAEFQAEEIVKLIDTQIATKKDLQDLKKDLILSIGGIVITGITILGVLIKMIGH